MNIRILLIVLFIFISNNSLASPKLKVLENFNKISNLSFQFKQTVNDKEETGNCIIKYPKKIYCKYESLFDKILVSNGKNLVIKTKKNNQYYRYSLDDTPLNFLLDKKYLINKIKELEMKIINDKYLNFSIESKNSTINIYFDKVNYNIVGWQTEDIYQNLAVTFIYNLKINEKIDEKYFRLPKID